MTNLPNSPLPLPGLGLAYWVEARGGRVAGGRRRPRRSCAERPHHGGAVQGRIEAAGRRGSGVEDIKANQWARSNAAFQGAPRRGRPEGEARRRSVEVTLNGPADQEWPLTDDRGLLQPDFRIQKATDVGDAVSLGAWRTVRFIKEVYMNLYAMVSGRVSAKTMSGPLTIANVSYRFAGEDFWQFLLFLGMISVNLAVVNFLPIPVLDGGHMVFLLLEKILGRPVPERMFAVAMYAGLA